MGTMDINNTNSLDGRIQYNNQGGQIFVTNSGTTPLALMGNFANGTTASGTGFKVAKPGYDVRTASDANLIFNSNYNTFKIISSGTLSLPSHTLSTFTTNTYTGTALSATINHNIGFVPAVIAYISFGVLMPYTSVSSGGTGGGILVTSYSIVLDSTGIAAQAYTTAYGGYNFNGQVISGQTIKYYLLQETAN